MYLYLFPEQLNTVISENLKMKQILQAVVLDQN